MTVGPAGGEARTAGRRPAVVLVGYYLPHSGFTRVLFSAFAPLARRFDLHLIGIGHQGDAFYRDGITVHPCNRAGGDAFGAFASAVLARRLGARVVFALNDIWNLRNYAEPWRELPASVQRMVYVPLDGELESAGLLAPLAQMDRVIAYTRFGREQLLKARARLGGRSARWRWRDVDVVPHGVDARGFAPMWRAEPAAERWSQRGRLRRRLFPDGSVDADAFVVLNANRPTPRKRLDLTIEGFARFARDKPPGVRLHLHHAIHTDTELDEVCTLAERHGVRERLLFTPRAPDFEYLSDAHLNAIYNAADVGVNTAMGEGWGLVSFEHAATGAPQVVPRSSACTELWADAALQIEPVRRYVPPYSPLRMAELSASAVADALERLYTDAVYRDRIGEAGRERACSREFSWQRVAARFEALFQPTSDRDYGCAPEPTAGGAVGEQCR